LLIVIVVVIIFVCFFTTVKLGGTNNLQGVSGSKNATGMTFKWTRAINASGELDIELI
jgi:hypothetical protein